MRLIDLNPEWVGFGGEGVTDADRQPIPRREKIALEFDCPCKGVCGQRPTLRLRNPPDGGPSVGQPDWEIVSGNDFTNLTLSPSIQRNSICRWHGHVKNGEITP